jgi:hypothetical protein
MDFYKVFSKDMENLEKAIKNNDSEKKHIKRSLDLAGQIVWDTSPQNNEFVTMLGEKGIAIFQKIIKRIKFNLKNQNSNELKYPKCLIKQAMFIHDLGKSDWEHDFEYNGKDHEERSYQIVNNNKERLMEIGWKEENIDLISYLAKYHGLLGITRTGEASMMYLSDRIKRIPHLGKKRKRLGKKRKRLFLDLLIIHTCCDSGASGDFENQEYDLGYARIKLYKDISDELIKISSTPFKNVSDLLRKFSEQHYIVEQIERIVTSGMRGLSVERDIIESVLNKYDQNFRENFVKTRFDAGFYVFEESLYEVNQHEKKITHETLEKFLNFIQLFYRKGTIPFPFIISFRDSFSLKNDVALKNRKNFDELLAAIRDERNEQLIDILKKFGF